MVRSSNKVAGHGRAAAVALALLPLVAGCPPAERPTQPDGPTTELPHAEVSLSIAVVGDAEIRGGIDRLRGEWNALTGGAYVAERVDAIAEADGHDLVVFPSRAIGELCKPRDGAEAGVLRPVRSGVLKLELLRFSDFEPAVREAEVVYGQRVMALPLGCPTPLWVGEAPATSNRAVAVSDDPVTLALEFLAWAAPHAVHPSREATLFDADTLRPRLAEPPFVRALSRLVEAANDATSDAPAARLVWPRRAESAPEALAADAIAPPPGVTETYNPLAGAWEPSDRFGDGATLVASSGRLIGVTTGSRNAATAFRLAAWLAGVENGLTMMTASDGVAVCRGSFARSADAWRAGVDRETARAFAASNAEALRRRRRLVTPRLPGADEYLAALGERVREAIEGAAGEEALADAVADWQAITDRIGRQRQTAAYAHSINAAPLD